MLASYDKFGHELQELRLGPHCLDLGFLGPLNLKGPDH